MNKYGLAYCGQPSREFLFWLWVDDVYTVLEFAACGINAKPVLIKEKVFANFNYPRRESAANDDNCID